MSLFSSKFSAAVKWLCIAQVLGFLLQYAFGDWVVLLLGLRPAQVWGDLRLWQLGTYLFLHGGFFHLLFNLFSLWMFGRELERVWGTKEFIKFYFLCGIGAGIFNVLLNPFSTLPVIGSSGAVYGLLVAFALVFPDVLIYLYGIIPMRSRNFALLLASVEFFTSFYGSSSMIARFAHLGGMLMGFLYLKSYEFRSFWTNLYHRFIDSLIVRKTARPQTPHKVFSTDELAHEVDRILQKILVQGVASLTEEEREIMQKYSARKR